MDDYNGILWNMLGIIMKEWIVEMMVLGELGGFTNWEITCIKTQYISH
jgi:hypothetical protein